MSVHVAKAMRPSVGVGEVCGAVCGVALGVDPPPLVAHDVSANIIRPTKSRSINFLK